MINCSSWQDPDPVCEDAQCLCWLAESCDVSIIEQPIACGPSCVDTDLEPNDEHALAVTLPCGDDAVGTDPPAYFDRCPGRDDSSSGFTHLEICAEGDRDFYQLYLLPDETAVIDVLFSHAPGLPEDLDLRAWRWEPGADDWVEVVSAGSTSDDETLTLTTTPASGHPEGWYLLEVYGKTTADTNTYTLAYTLNGP